MKNQHIKLSDLTHFSEKQQVATATADQHKFTLYGGAAGGGKSYWLRWYSIRWLIKTYEETNLKGLMAGLFSEDYPTLKDRHVGKLELEVPAWLGIVKEDKSFGLCLMLDVAFGRGVLVLRNLDDPSKYMSTEFGLVAIDELTKNKKAVFDNLRSRLRWPGLEGKTKFIAGTNPGQVGHAWVKALWIDKFFPPEEEESDQFAFIQAFAKDNPQISKDYIKALSSLPERMRRALLEGDWDLVEGQFFSEFRKEKHVIKTIPRDKMPLHWVNLRSIDVSGRNGITSCHWYILDGDGVVRAYREYYMTGKDSDEHAREIWYASRKQKPNGDYEPDEGYKYTMMDSAAWSKLGLQESIAEVYLRIWAELDNKHGVDSSNTLVPTIKGKGSRVHGWDTLHQYLRWDKKHDPEILFMENCPNLIRTLPLMVTDDKNPDDVNTKGEDHAPDELRYLLQTLRDQKVPGVESPIQTKLREMREVREQKLHNSKTMVRVE